MRRTRWIAGLVAIATMPNLARAEDAVPPSDRIEAVQHRVWLKRGALMLEPQASVAFNDPFLARGGGGLRAVYWISFAHRCVAGCDRLGPVAHQRRDGGAT